MRSGIGSFIATAVALYAAAYFVPGINLQQGGDTLSNIGTVLFVALVFGIINALVKPIISLLSLPITILTLGLFMLIINAAMLMLTSWIAGAAFNVEGWIPAILGSIVISIVGTFVGMLLSSGDDD
jgi:putative membrane protein